MLYIYDVLVIGGGPAGLAAGVVLKNASKNYLILEKGKDIIERNANDSADISSGIGGCGLFSDGKLSFFPSASYLWTHLDRSKLEKSYMILLDMFRNLGINIPEWDTRWISYDNNKITDNCKNYASIVLSSFMRSRILNFFYDINTYNIKANCCVSDILRVKDYYEITTLSSEVYYARNLIIATGKFGNNLLHKASVKSNKALIDKLELGVRLETLSSLFKPYYSPNADFKLILPIEKNVEFRTFCCCKDGIVIKSEFDNYASFNGAKVQFKSQYSNIGLLIRTMSNNNDYYKEINNILSSNLHSFKVPLEEFINSNKVYIGKKSDNVLKNMINKIIDLPVDNINSSYIYGPEIEYIGGYIDSGRTLCINNNIWLAGDITGKFRGLIAALVSGIYCANEIKERYKYNILNRINKLGIKVSNTKNMDLVFTAQSKNYFYCKDVICEYVLKQNKVPINPFMVFNYFLNDRVDRNLVRQGNNQLIQTCKELWVFGPIADGVLFEIAIAKLYGKPVRFYKLGTRIEEIKEIEVVDNNSIVFEPEVHSKKIKKNDLIDFIKSSNIDDGQLSLFNVFTEGD